MISKRGELGIIDFQYAVWGPITYDLVSLLRDCYIELSENEIRHWLEVVYQRLINDNLLHISYEKFEVDFDLMGCQRHLKAIGIFSRLKHRDGKPNYMKDVPRTLGYLKRSQRNMMFLSLSIILSTLHICNESHDSISRIGHKTYAPDSRTT